MALAIPKLGQCRSHLLWYRYADQNIPDHDNFCVTRNVKHKNLIKIRNSNIYYIIRMLKYIKYVKPRFLYLLSC